ncbi:MAG: hypothetical protein LW875_00115 [Proteobacteria bacterium]|jgi:hypothetical protein|nr:hypothetical protein [Pseudomonadota bacterium]
MKFISPDVQFIFLQRQNVWENCLSFLLSHETLKFYSPKGLQFDRNSVRIHEKTFELFCIYKNAYEIWKENLPVYRELIFEGFETEGSDYILSQLSYPQVEKFQLRYPKQNPGSKEDSISNLQDVRKWFDQQNFK